MPTFQELMAKAIEHAEEADRLLHASGHRGPIAEASAHAGVHATLAEAYARMASAVIVNQTSMNAVLGTHKAPGGGN